MAANTVVTVFDEVVNLEGKIFVWFTDKYLSGWGGAGYYCQAVEDKGYKIVGVR